MALATLVKLYTLSRVLLALGDFPIRVCSIFHFGNFKLIFSNSAVTKSLVTALLKCIDMIFY